MTIPLVHCHLNTPDVAMGDDRRLLAAGLASPVRRRSRADLGQRRRKTVCTITPAIEAAVLFRPRGFGSNARSRRGTIPYQ